MKIKKVNELTQSPKREDGFYWIKLPPSKKWSIGKYTFQQDGNILDIWDIINSNMGYKDCSFSEIGRKIEEPS